eukprot:238210-Alexandrium_andersonii.AAC.1
MPPARKKPSAAPLEQAAVRSRWSANRELAGGPCPLLRVAEGETALHVIERSGGMAKIGLTASRTIGAYE